jgi:4-amino-4-deoxy-L-arabinose transferase-like glycosyltransferase
MSRPGYPALENILQHLSKLTSGLAGALLLNFLFAFGAAMLLYYVVKDHMGKKIAFVSALLLLLSTHFHVFIGQAHTEIAGDFVTICNLFLLQLYLKHKSTKNLLLIALACGLLMLIKFVFAMPIFFLLLALKYREIRTYGIFILVSILPTLSWYLYVTKVLNTPFVSAEVSTYQQGTWFLHFLPHPSMWGDLVRAFVYSNGLFVIDTMLAFLVVLPVLSVYGLSQWTGSRDKNFWYWSYVCSFALMLFLMLWGGARLAFGAFPVILPFAVFGFFQLCKRYSLNERKTAAFGAVMLLALVFLASVNVYRLIPKYDFNDIRTISDIHLQ